MRKSVIFSALLSASLMGGALAKADTNCNGWGSQNLIVNCGFEDSNTTLAGWSGTATTDFSYAAGVDQGDPFAIGTTPYQGSNEAYLGALESTDTLTQTFSTTVGQTYTIQFALL